MAIELPPIPVYQIIGEPILVLLMFLPVLFYKPIREAYFALTRRQQIVTYLLALFIIVGQLTPYDRVSFPFVTWYMYAQIRSGDPPIYTMKGTTNSGSEVDLVPTRLFPTLSGKRLMSRLHKQISHLQVYDHNEKLFSEHHGVVWGLVAVYNRKYPEDPIQSVSVYRADFPMDPKPKALPHPLTHRLLWTLEKP